MARAAPARTAAGSRMRERRRAACRPRRASRRPAAAGSRAANGSHDQAVPFADEVVARSRWRARARRARAGPDPDGAARTSPTPGRDPTTTTGHRAGDTRPAGIGLPGLWPASRGASTTSLSAPIEACSAVIATPSRTAVGGSAPASERDRGRRPGRRAATGTDGSAGRRPTDGRRRVRAGRLRRRRSRRSSRPGTRSADPDRPATCARMPGTSA